jgi:hypothetical protein
VLDHLAGDPVEWLTTLRDLMATAGRAYVRCHPWVSRHGGHGYHGLNRAYCHLLLGEDELRRLGWDGEVPARKVSNPKTYRTWFEAAGLRVVAERPVTAPPEKFFRIPQIAKRLQPYEEWLDVLFVDYLLCLAE